MFWSEPITCFAFFNADFWNVAKEFDGLKVLYGIDAHCKEQIELFEDSVKLVNKWIGEDIISSLYFCDENLK